MQRAIPREPGHFELRLAGEFDGDEFREAFDLGGGGHGERPDHAIAERRAGVQRGVQVLPRVLGLARAAGEEHAEQPRLRAVQILGEAENLLRMAGLVVGRRARVGEDEEIRRLGGERGAQQVQRSGAPGVEEFQGPSPGAADLLPRAVAQILLPRPQRLTAEERVDEFHLPRAGRAEQHEPRRALEEEEGLDRGDLAEDRLLERRGQAVDEAFEFFVEGEEGGGFHRRRWRARELTPESRVAAG